MLKTTNGVNAKTMESLVIGGDLSKLSSKERVQYYGSVCESLKLNPLTKPFDYIKLNGKLTLYARKDATDQLRQIHGISIRIEKRDLNADLGLCIVDVIASLGDRTDFATGAVNIHGLKGDNLANAIMKAETKGKRRATLSIVGLGWADETEIENIPQAESVDVDEQTGEILESKTLEKANDLKETMLKEKITELIASEHIPDDERIATVGWLKKDHKLSDYQKTVAKLEKRISEELPF